MPVPPATNFTFQDVGACNCCSVAFTVRGCANPYTAATLTVSVYDSTDTILLATGTTATGTITLAWAGSTGTYHVHVSGQSARYQSYNTSQTLTCGSPTTLTLLPASGYHCAGTVHGVICQEPTTTVLNCTFAVAGATTLTFATTNWHGSIVDGFGNTWAIVWPALSATFGANACTIVSGEVVVCPPSLSDSGTLNAGICTTNLGAATITE